MRTTVEDLSKLQRGRPYEVDVKQTITGEVVDADARHVTIQLRDGATKQFRPEEVLAAKEIGSLDRKSVV